MDDSKEGFLLIITTTIILVTFLVTLLSVMIIYRNRKLHHQREVASMKEKFSKELLQAQIEVQQQTMQYIGREIHDNVGQKLVLAALYTQHVDHPDAYTAGKITAIMSIIQESLQDLRSLSQSLLASSMFTESLWELLLQECLKVTQSGICLAQLSGNAQEVSMSQSIKSFLLRILQEFIQNSLKHATCNHILISMETDNAQLEIQATDDGSGFDIHKLVLLEGFGLTNMRKRAEMIQASFRLDSQPGMGTSMTISLPLEKLTT